MKVRLVFSLEVSDDDRKAIAYSVGDGLGAIASYDQVQEFYRLAVHSTIRDALAFPRKEYYQAQANLFREKSEAETATGQKTLPV